MGIIDSYRIDVDCLVLPKHAASTGLLRRVLTRTLQGAWVTPLSFVFADMAMVLASALCVHFACELFHVAFHFSSYFPLLFPLIFAAPLIYAMSGLYPGIALNPVRESRRVCLTISTFYLLLLAASAIFVHNVRAELRIVLVATWAVNVLIAPLGRSLLRTLLARRTWWGMPTVVIGHGDAAKRLFRTLSSHQEAGLRPCAIVDVREPELILQDEDQDPPAPVYALTATPFLAREHHYAVLASKDLSELEYAKVVNQYADAFGHLMMVPDFDQTSNLWITTKEIGGKLTLELNQPLAMRSSQIAKRVIDLLVILGVCIVTAPLFLLLYVLIRVTSKGPAFYGHLRIGRRQQPFRAWKFRTMVQNADQVLQAHLAKHPELRAEWEMDQKLRKDPRVTVVGRILRKLSLDELPQVWNVLRGEMSLVGPRPIVTNEIVRYGDRYAFYQKVRPGITGLWQVSGRNNTTYEERTAYDEYYVRNWSAWLDVYILFRTIKAVLFAEGAY
jgi:Undecaprenyl-phosphate galactose phosphotransferase WbaP